MKSSDPCGFALHVGRSMLVCLLPVGSVGVKMMQSQRHALEKINGSDPVELSVSMGNMTEPRLIFKK